MDIIFKVFQFPSPRGAEGIPTPVTMAIRHPTFQFPSPRGAEGIPTVIEFGKKYGYDFEFPSPRGAEGIPTKVRP